MAFWGSSESLEGKVRCFMVIKEVVRSCSHEVYTSILKKMYAHFLKNNNQLGWRNYDLCIVMMNSFIEIMAKDLESSYVILFNLLRKVAEFLKETMKKKVPTTPKSHHITSNSPYIEFISSLLMLIIMIHDFAM
jgi:Noc2p family